jgi:fimbrial chaperone protein
MGRKIMIKKLFAVFALFVVGFLLTATEARADLSITPIRVVFEAHDHSAAVELLNLTDHRNTYRFGWIYLKALPDGKYEKVFSVKDDDPFGVPNMVIFSPRQVTIEPHGHQIVRLSLRRPANLPPGEYRAHLTMTRLAKMEPYKPDPTAKTVELALQANVGFSIPVIVRQGEDKDLKVSLSDPELEMQGSGTLLKVNINRVAGKFSSYGTIKVFWTPLKGDEKQIGLLSNLSLYPELKTRAVMIPLATKDNIASGMIRIIYEGKLESEGTLWAEKTFPVGK